MFKITRNKGFHITFENGYTVSVQFGPGNYCQNYDAEIGSAEEESAAEGSDTAECAVWGPDSGMIAHPAFDGDTVGGYMTPADVLKLLNWAEEQAA